MSDSLGKPGEACGVFGAFVPETHVANLIYFGLFALQHRGQESAGIAVSNGQRLTTYKDMGLLSSVFDRNTLAGLQGGIGIGHTRYSTTGSSTWANAQPAFRAIGPRSVALGHNGNLTNTAALAERLGSSGTTDSELMTSAIAERIHKESDIPLWEAIAGVVPDFEGAYTLVVMDDTSVVAVRDPHGFRPLSLGRIGPDGWVVASETAALDLVGATFERDVEPGELVVLDERGVTSHFPQDPVPSRLCVFEYVYFARPDSVLAGQNVQAARVEMGRQLARESGVPADVVVPVPESGIPAAQGYSWESGIRYEDGLVKNRYVGRTFIEPEQMLRERGIRLKLNPIKDVLDGQRIVLVDDSVVRGSTTRQLVEVVRAAGAQEVHLRISSPPYRWPCFYGMDTSDRSSLLAAGKSEEEIEAFLGVDSLGYLSLAGLEGSVSDATQTFCTACLSGDYPTPIGPDKFVLE
ncbi:MAG: amidophosphoribosyltransferase [Acidimicrobiia bacterium]|nr:amidophosphoribosyltransferase [Acidimicrobiia bacterium]MBT8216429.1 amidophosphoribosyltransferase [Acidimicrobiia bacterium]NNF09706.1 amidophosphoribosyltransferase [Acidimicrobiia bacterium]NNL71384.1 amidophosphoribosyltransferase [Acidimicrobiia bacterium]